MSHQEVITKLSQVPDWPYLKPGSYALAKTKLEQGDEFIKGDYQLKWNEYKSKLEGSGWDYDEIKQLKRSQNLPSSEKYPPPFILEKTLRRHISNGTLNMSEKQVQYYIKKYSSMKWHKIPSSNKLSFNTLSHIFVDGIKDTWNLIKNNPRKTIIIFVLLSLIFILIPVVGITNPPTEPPTASPPTEPPTASPPTEPPTASPPTEPPTASPPTEPPAEPVDCVGDWEEVAGATCSVDCGGGTIQEVYKISKQAQNGGQVCPNEDGDTRNTKECNTQPCPPTEEELWGPLYAPITIDPGSACLEKAKGRSNKNWQLDLYYVVKDDSMKRQEIRRPKVETYVSKVYASSTTECDSNWIYNDKHCFTSSGLGTTFKYAYSYGGRARKPTFDTNLCSIDNADECLYVCYRVDGQPVQRGDYVSEIKNAKGESLMDRLIDDVWCDKIKHEDFEDVIKYMTSGTGGALPLRYTDDAPSPYTPTRNSGTIYVRPGDILLNRLDEWKTTGHRHYNYVLQILHMLLVKRRDGAAKPYGIILEFRMTAESS